MARTILVADDSPSIQNKAKGILTGEGVEVVTVSNGVAAIKKLPSLKPLLVIADVSMPGRDGYEVCEFVKNSPDLSHVPVVLIFSDMEPYDEHRGAQVRADATIKKKSGVRDPFDHEELISTVTKFLAQAEAAVRAEATLPPPQPEPSVVVEPVDEEPQIAKREEAPELAALSEGVAFGEAGFEEAGAPPPEAGAEPAGLPSEVPAGEVPPAGEEETIYAEPVLIEDTEPVVAEPGEPTVERTMVFRAPVEISEPVLSDELAAAEEPTAEPAPAAEAPPIPEPEAPSVSASSLEGFSLTEAATGQVRFEPGEAPEAPVAAEPAVPAPEAPPAAEPPAPEPEAAPPPAPAPTLDPELIYSIIHKTVMKMAPPAFPAQAIEDMARKFADEIIAELSSECSQGQ